MEFQNLLPVTSDEAMRFFYSGLKETGAGGTLPELEVKYLASVLAHYSQYSIGAPTSQPTPPADLVQVFDQFILTKTFHEDVEILHLAGSQCLFILGCFWHQMKRRHNRQWFVKYGKAYYLRASYLSKVRGEVKLFWRVAQDFEPCIHACRELQANLRDAPYLLH